MNIAIVGVGEWGKNNNGVSGAVPEARRRREPADPDARAKESDGRE